MKTPKLSNQEKANLISGFMLEFITNAPTGSTEYDQRWHEFMFQEATRICYELHKHGNARSWPMPLFLDSDAYPLEDIQESACQGRFIQFINNMNIIIAIINFTKAP